MNRHKQHQNASGKSRSRSRGADRRSDQDRLTQELMRKKVRQAIENGLDEAEFEKRCDEIARNLDPNQIDWVPFKVKKQVADQIKDILKGTPQEFSAQQKLKALILLNKAIHLRNNQFNRYVENTMMARLSMLAQYDPHNHSDDSVSNASSMRPSMHNSAQELLKRGEKIFGPSERDHKSSSRFLVILLDSIEKWSKIEVGDCAPNKDRKVKREQQRGSSDDDLEEDEPNYLQESDFGFKKVYEHLLSKDVTFPSRFRKQVGNNLNQDDDLDEDVDGISDSRTDDALSHSSENFSSSCQSQVLRLDSATKKEIMQLQTRMLTIKKAAKKCKRFIGKCEKHGRVLGEQARADDAQKLKQLFLDSAKMAERCQKELKSKRLGSHIENQRDLIRKMEKYANQFTQGSQLIDRLDSSPSKFQRKSEDAAKKRSTAGSDYILEKKSVVACLKEVKDEERAWAYSGDKDKEEGDRGVDMQPRMSEQLRLDLDIDESFDQQSNQSFSALNFSTPSGDIVIKMDPTTKGQQPSYSQLIQQNRDLTEQVEFMHIEIAQLKSERDALFSQLEKKADSDQRQEFENSDLVRGYEVAISTLNFEIQKCKREHKNEMRRQKEEADDQAEQLKKCVFQLETKLQDSEEEIKKREERVQELGEYQEKYREKIQSLEEQLAQRYYEDAAAENVLRVGNKINSEGDAKTDLNHSRRANPRDEQSSCILSPLNFSRLAFGGDMSMEQSAEEEDQEKSVVLLESFVNSNSNRGSYNQRDSHESNQSNPSLRYTLEGSERLSAMLRDSDEKDRQKLLSSETKKKPLQYQKDLSDVQRWTQQNDKEEYGDINQLRNEKQIHSQLPIKSPQDDPIPYPADFYDEERCSSIVCPSEEYPATTTSQTQAKAALLTSVMKQEFMARLNSQKANVGVSQLGNQSRQAHLPFASKAKTAENHHQRLSSNVCPIGVNEGVQIPMPSHQRKSNEELNGRKAKAKATRK